MTAWRLDHGREQRIGLVEAVYGPGKSTEQCASIVAELLAEGGHGPVLLTRATPEQIATACARNPGGRVIGRTVTWRPARARAGAVAVLTAGTADLPVADECVATLRAYGYAPTLVTDIGVAGLHRFLDHQEALASVDAVVVVAGMEGALASIVGGAIAAPIVAVPTSVGYGSSFEGITALLAMLASCAQGVSVVGIDNGFGAACAVVRLLHRIERARA